MDIRDFLKELEEDPKNLKRFTLAQDSILAEGSAEDLNEFLEEFFKLHEGDPGVETFLIQVGHKARSVKDSDFGDVLYTFLGKYYLDRLSNREKAEIYLRNVSVTDENRAYLTSFYVDFYAEKENWRRLEEFLTKNMEVAEGENRESMVKKYLAEIAELKSRPEKAVAFLQGALAANPDDAPVAQELKRLYHQIGKWHSLIDLLDKEIASLDADDVVGRTALMKEVALVYRENVGSDTKAVSVYQSILEIAPNNIEIIDTLAELYTRLQRWADLVQVLRSKHEAVEEEDEKVSILFEIGRILMEKYSKTAEAVEAYETILNLQPRNSDALDKIKEIHEKRRDYERLIEVNKREIALEGDEALRFQRSLDLARMANERVRKMDVLISLWDEVLQADPKHLEAIQNLERLYERQKEWDQLGSILERELDLAEGDRDRLKILDKLAMIYSVRVKDEALTADVYRRILDVDSGNRKAISELKKIYVARADWQSLDWLYRNHGTLGDLVRVLEGRVNSVEEPESQVALLTTIANLWLDELDQKPRAVRTLERVLDIDARNAEAAERLIPIYREMADWRKLIAALLIKLEFIEDPADKQDLHVEVAQILENNLHEAPDAFFHYADALRLGWQRDDIRDDLYRLADATDNHDALVLTLVDVVEGVDDETARLEFYRDMARLYDEKLAKVDEALVYYDKVLELYPEDVATLIRIEQIHRAAGNYALLAEALGRRIPLIEEADQRREVLLLLAAIRDEHLDDVTGAIEAYQGILEDAADDLEVLDKLIGLYLKAEAWEELEAAIDTKLVVLAEQGEDDGVRVAEQHKFLGMITWGTRQDAAATVTAYEKALDAEPGRADVVELLEELISVDAVQARIAGVLRPIYEITESWQRLADVFGILLLHAEERDERLELLFQRGGVFHRHLERPGDAFACLSEYFQLDPTNDEVRQSLFELSGELEREADLIRTFEQRLKEATNPDVVVALSYLLARLHTEKMGDLDRGARYFKDVLDIRPAHSESLDALESIYEGQGRFEELIEIYRKKADLATDDADRVAFYFRLARVYYEHMENRGEAIAILEDILSHDDAALEAYRFLDRIHLEGEDWPSLRGVLEKLLPLLEGEPEERVEVMKRLAKLLEDKLEEDAEAVSVLKGVLEVDAGNAFAIEELERFFAEEKELPAVLDILEPHYMANDAWQSLIVVLEHRIGLTEIVPDRVQLHFRISETYLSYDEDTESAFIHYGDALRLAPDDTETLDRVDEVVEQTGDARALVDLLSEVVDRIDDGAVRKRVLSRIGYTAADELDEPEKAVTAFQAFLEIDARDLIVTERLAELLRGLERWAELIGVLRDKADLMEEEEPRKELLLEVGRITFEVLEQLDQATGVYEEIYAAFSGERQALDALEALYGRTERWEKLIWVYDEFLTLSEEEADRKRYLNEKALLFELYLKDVDSAILSLMEILEIDEADLDSLRKLDELYQVKGDWHHVIGTLERIQPLVEEAEATQIEYRIGRIRFEQLDDAAAAIPHFETVLAADDMAEAAISSLKEVFDQTELKERVLEVLEPLFSELERWAELVAILEAMVKFHDEIAKRQSLLNRIASLYEDKLEDVESAFGALCRWLGLEPASESIMDTLISFSLRNQHIEQLIEKLEAIATEETDPAVEYFLRQKVALILKDHVSDAERAVLYAEEALEAFPSDAWFLRELDTLYTNMGAHKDLARILDAEIAISEEATTRVELLIRKGNVAEESLGDLDIAFEAYRDILMLVPNDETAVEHLRGIFSAGHRRIEVAELLEPVYQQAEDWDALLILGIEKIEDIKEDDDRFVTCQHIAQLYLDKKDDLIEAIRWNGEGFRLHPWDVELERTLIGYAEDADAWRDVAVIFLDAASRDEVDLSRRIELLKKTASIHEERLDARADALEIFKRVHDLDAEEADALASMARIYGQLERWADLAATLEKRVALDQASDARVALLLELAQVHLNRLDDLDRARDTYVRVLELDDHQRDALVRLSEIYEIEEDHEARYRVVESLYEIAQSDGERVELLFSMARMQSGPLSNADEAIRLLEEIIAIDPTNLDALHLLQERLESAESWERLVEIFQLELESDELDQLRRMQLNKESARIAFELLEDPFQAQDAMERALELAPEDRDAIQFLRRVYRENAQFQKLRDTVEKLLETTEDDAEKGALYEELGEIYTDYLHDPDSAIKVWTQLLDIDASNRLAITNLEKLYRDEQRWADFVLILDLKLDLIEETEDKKLTLLEIASCYLDRLGDWTQAAGTYERLIELDADDEDTYPLLERIYEENGRYEELSVLLEKKLSIIEDVEDKLFLFERLGRIRDEKLLDANGALQAYQSAFFLDKSNSAVVDEFEKIAIRSEKWQELFEIYTVLAQEIDEEERVEVLTKSARVASEHLDSPKQATALFQAILEIEPENEPALRALQEIFEKAESWRDLIGVLKQLVTVALDPVEQVSFQNEVARLYEEKLSDAEAAIREYRATLEIDEMDTGAVQALERIFREREDHASLVEALLLKINLHPEREAEYKMEIGQLFEHQLDEHDKAIETYEEVLSFHPQNRQALERLEMLYSEKEDYRALSEVFERLLFASDDPQERLRVCQNLALLQEQVFESKEGAIEFYLKIREIERDDEDAIGNLDRLFRELGMWEDTIQLDRELLEGASDDATRERLQRDMATIYLDQLEDLDNGIAELKAVMTLCPDDEEVQLQLQAILSREEMWEDMVELKDFQADHAIDDADRIDVLYEKAELLKDKLFRSTDVIEVLDRIIDLDASQTRALEMLGEQHQERGEVDPYLERLEKALESVTADLPVTWIHTAIGRLYDQQLNNIDAAIDHLEKALTYMPDYVDAIEPLADIYVRKEKWESAEPLLNLLLRRYEESQDLNKQCELFFRIGRTAENLLDTERALVFYKKAINLRDDYYAALYGLGRLNYRKGYYDQAERFYNDALNHAEDDLPMEERLQMYKALGDIALKQGNADKAGEYLQQVIDYHPDSEDVLEDLATFMAMHEDWDNHIRYKRELAYLKKDEIEKLDILLSVGDTLKEKLGRFDAAIDGYRDVLAIAPGNRAAYLRLFQLHVEQQQFEDAVQILDEMNRDEQDVERRATNYLTVAELYRAKLDMPTEAIEYYNKALDEMPSKLEAFRAIDEILTRTKQWKQLEAAYLTMVKRVRGRSDMGQVEYMLFKNLGEIYRSRLQQYDYAISSYQLAAKLRPDDVPIHEILADLYERVGKHEQAIEEHRGLIIAQPSRVESYRTLFRLFSDMKAYDKAWCMAGILNLLKKANEQERNFYRQSRAVTITSAKRPLEDIEVRENVLFQRENRMVGEVYQIIYQIIGSRLRGRELKELGLKRKHSVDITRQEHPIHDLLLAINRYLRVPLPVVYRSGQASGIRLADINPPALIIGEDVYRGSRSSQELAYVLGKYMSYFHPLHRMAALYNDPTRLKVLYLAAEYHCFPDTYTGVRSEAVESAAKELGQYSNANKTRQLAQALEEARAAEGGKTPSIDRWISALEYSAVNLGFTTCNDIEVCANLERDPSLSLSGLQYQDKIRALVMYAMSRRYETVTSGLGIQIQQSSV